MSFERHLVSVILHASASVPRSIRRTIKSKTGKGEREREEGKFANEGVRERAGEKHRADMQFHVEALSRDFESGYCKQVTANDGTFSSFQSRREKMYSASSVNLRIEIP